MRLDNGGQDDPRDPGGPGSGRFGSDFDEGLGSHATEDLLLPPWERRERYGLLNGLYLTVKDVLMAPGRFFHRMPTEVGLGQPLLFAIALGVIASLFSWMWTLTGSSLQVLLAQDQANAFKAPLVSFLAFLFSPLTVAIRVFIQAGLIHLCLGLVGGNRLGFEATFRVAAYSEATGILSLVPVCGSVISFPWALVVAVIGLYSIHETEPWKAVVAVLLPFIAYLAMMGLGAALLVTGLGFGLF